jgi:hypothetical protein
MKVEWSEELLKEVVHKSLSRKEVLDRLNIRSAGGNFKTLKKYLELYSIETDHFIKNYDKIVDRNKNNKIKTEDILVENSTYGRSHLKNRLYEEGFRERKCCLCGQGEEWNGMKISLILDHINGIHNDNRIENLRIVCPNCNAGLDTFAGKNNKIIKKEYICECGKKMSASSTKCNTCDKKSRRKIERPEYDILIKEVEELGYSATGRKYGVSDNSIRKWLLSFNI